MMINEKELMEAALKARELAYAPYSHFYVGAALLSDDGVIYTGCNVENSSYSVTNCAERTALYKAVSEGKRKFTALALCGGTKGEKLDICTPCGTCRQALYEFCSDEMPIYLIKEGGYETTTLGALLPLGFRFFKDKE